MRQTKVFQTDENAYEVTQLAADKEGRAAFLRAQRLAFKASGGIESLVADMSDADLDYFCELFGKYTKLIQPDGKKPVLGPIFSTHFSGADGWFEMVKWLAFCLGLNFGPFFLHLFADGGAVKAAALEGAGPAASSEQTGSPGES
jgi:hypothetical protein